MTMRTLAALGLGLATVLAAPAVAQADHRDHRGYSHYERSHHGRDYSRGHHHRRYGHAGRYGYYSVPAPRWSPRVYYYYAPPPPPTYYYYHRRYPRPHVSIYLRW